jgi:hypothetical protein
MDKQVQFFFEHGGYSYDAETETAEQGRLRCAQALAEAETAARDAGVTFEWGADGDTNRAWTDDGDEYGTWACAAFVDTDHSTRRCIGSLCGIDLGIDGHPSNDPYSRVVEAEVAAEALQNL